MDILANILEGATWRHRAFGPDSQVINGQLVPVMGSSVWSPVAWGPLPGRTGTPAPVPTIPPIVGNSGGGYGGPGNAVGGGGTANDATAAVAADNPWSLKLSPLPWALGFLIVGLLGLRWIHWS